MRCFPIFLLSTSAFVVTIGVTLSLVVYLWPGCWEGGGPKFKPVPDNPIKRRERWRPIYHYTPNVNWVSNPNGLVFYKGEYHMFYEYNTNSIKYENISWGHAVSPDLVNWQELQPAILADYEEEIRSGSAIVDKENVAGLGTSETHAMLAFYTSYQVAEPNFQSQSLAYSLDLGHRWTKYKKNPILDLEVSDFRDPKVIKVSDGWIMLVQLSEQRSLQFYKSTNLINWTKVGQFPEEGKVAGAYAGTWENPDLFELPVDGNPMNTKWVLIVTTNHGNKYGEGSAVQYFIGSFNGTTFVDDDSGATTRWVDHGMDYYAATSFTDVPYDRRVMIGWLSNWEYAEDVPTRKWKNGMSIAREVYLQNIDGNLMLVQRPVENLVSLRKGPLVHGNGITLTEDNYNKRGMQGEAIDIVATITCVDAKTFGIKVHASEDRLTVVGFEKVENGFHLYVDRTKSGITNFSDKFKGQHGTLVRPSNDGKLHLRVLVDANSVEVFGGIGEVTITELVFPDQPYHGVTFFAAGGSIYINEFHIWKLEHISER